MKVLLILVEHNWKRLKFGYKEIQVCFRTIFRKIKKNSSWHKTVFDKINCWYKYRKHKKSLQRINFIIFWQFLMFFSIFYSAQVKWWGLCFINMIFLSCLTSCQTTRTKDLRKLKAMRNITSLLAKMKVLLILEENSSKIESKFSACCAISHEK